MNNVLADSKQTSEVPNEKFWWNLQESARKKIFLLTQGGNSRLWDLAFYPKILGFPLKIKVFDEN